VRYSTALRVVHEDEDFLIVEKPSGLLTANQPGETRESLFDLVKEHVRGARGKPRRVWIVHRLDKEASGLLAFAKSERAYAWLKEELRHKRVHRLYTAVVEGEWKASAELARVSRQALSGTIQSFIADEEFGIPRSVEIGEVARERSRAQDAPGGRGRGGRTWSDEPSRTTLPDDPNSPKLAVTHWRVLSAGHGRSLVQLRLETGRKNQIRVHMSEAKHPIVGDQRFGAQTDPIGRVALHATELGFTHPGTHQAMRFHSPVPKEFSMLVGGTGKVEALENAAHDAGTTRTDGQDVDRDDRKNAGVAAAAKAETSWEPVAAWYDDLIEGEKSDHFRDVIVPGTMRLLSATKGERVLDVACGQGALCRRLGDLGVVTAGVDASPALIEAAKSRGGSSSSMTFFAGDARALASIEGLQGAFDGATCVMALMNIDRIEPVFKGVRDLLRPGGRFVGVILHPAFRAPGQTSWGWDDSSDRREERGKKKVGSRARLRQFRRVDGYLSEGQSPITMNPGSSAHGAEPVVTWTFHRPIQGYVKALASAGLLVDAMEEWSSLRTSQPGPRATEENRARREIPMFLAFRAVRAS
jgi:23S rRNA-/tRNA-specific pseudouridylate synthase/SAM-dependent methyltransferase